MNMPRDPINRVGQQHQRVHAEVCGVDCKNPKHALLHYMNMHVHDHDACDEEHCRYNYVQHHCSEVLSKPPTTDLELVLFLSIQIMAHENMLLKQRLERVIETSHKLARR
jgi:hypothetical protein